jgi:hypothetical protein
MSLSMKKSPEVAMTFSSEKQARRFAALALGKLPRVKVSFDGTKVRIKHGERDAHAVYALMRHAKQMKRQQRAEQQGAAPGLSVNMAAATTSTGPAIQQPERSSDLVRDSHVGSLSIYFADLENAKRTEQALRASGAQVSRDDRTISVKNGDRRAVNRVIAELHGNPMPPDPVQARTGMNIPDLPQGYSLAAGDLMTDWEIGFGARRRVAEVSAAALRQRGVKYDLAGTKMRVYSQTYNNLMKLLTTTMIDRGDLDKNGVGEARIADMVRSGPHQIGDSQPVEPLNQKYLDPKAKTSDLFKQYIVDFTSEVGAAKAADFLRSRGVELTLIGGGYLLLAFREVLARVVQDAITRYGGSVLKAFTQKGRIKLPSFSRPKRDDSAQRAAAIRRGGSTAPAVLQRSSVTPPAKSTDSYKVKGGGKSRRSDPSKGVFSLSQDKELALDYVGIAFAVMDFISDQTTRAVADALVESGIKFVHNGTKRIIAKVKDQTQARKIQAIAKEQGATVRMRRAGPGKQAKSAAMSFGSVMESILTEPAPNGGRVLRKQVIPTGIVLVTGSIAAAEYYASKLISRGVKAIAKGVRVLVRKPKEAGAAMSLESPMAPAVRSFEKSLRQNDFISVVTG